MSRLGEKTVVWRRERTSERKRTDKMVKLTRRGRLALRCSSPARGLTVGENSSKKGKDKLRMEGMER